MTIDRDLRAPADPTSEDVVRLDGAGAELVVRPESALARVRNSALTARAVSAARGVATSPTVGQVARTVATWTVTGPAGWVGPRLARFVTGQPMIGRTRTDATFWRAATRQHRDVPGRAEAWSHLPGYQRASVRFAAVVLLWTLAAALWPTETAHVTAAAAAVGAVWGAWGIARWWSGRAHRKRFLRPLHDALRGAVGSTASRPEEWLHVPRDFTSSTAETRIDLPATFDGSDGSQNHVKTVVRNKLGLDPDCTVKWNLAGHQPYVIFRNPPQPPRRVGLTDVIDLIRSAPDTRLLCGLAAGGAPVWHDLESDSPHLLVSAGSGAGKSVLLRLLAAQGLAKGGYGIILDVKRVSHPWAANIPNCEYHRTAEAIHERLISLQAELDRRTAIVVQHMDIDGNTDHIDVGPRIYVLAEEMNATIARLNAYWRKIKEKGEPNTSPAVEALLDLLFMGRQVKVHVLAVAQMASARSLGGPEARENFATRCLARYTVNAWKMLVPEVMPVPKKSKIQGRWEIVSAGVSTPTQVAFLTSREARNMALAGYSGEFDATGPVPASQVSHGSSDLVQAPGTVPGDDDEPGAEEELDEIPAQVVVGLREAIVNGVVEGWTLENLRKARTRYHHFPVHVSQRGQELLYDADELAQWSRNHRAQFGDESNSTADGIG
jgi:hypothetical protein